ncbi:MAG: YafY family protein [Chloroflexota bacterium]|nr:YafY family protein [Chloroflexota bacterium]
MRADRLLSILMILQARGKVTARKLSEELEVSERTIYRDVIALSTAGVPVYTDRGPGGGISLIESYRTTLTGMSEEEVQALFMLSIPTPLADLGVSQELRGALLKLAASLPQSTRQAEAHVRSRIHLDWDPWFQEQESVPNLQLVQRAVWEDRKLLIAYDLPFDTRVERTVEPYGLVAKANEWYLVYQRGGIKRVIRVSQILNAKLLEERFEREGDFDLKAFWEGWCADAKDNRPVYEVTLRVSAEMVSHLPWVYAEIEREMIVMSDPDENGWTTVRLQLHTLERARLFVLSLGRSVEVLEPLALRDSVVDYARQIVGVYEE